MCRDWMRTGSADTPSSWLSGSSHSGGVWATFQLGGGTGKVTSSPTGISKPSAKQTRTSSVGED